MSNLTRLSKAQIQKKEALRQALESKADALKAAIEDYNGALVGLFAPVLAAKQSLVTAIEEAETFAGEIADEIADEMEAYHGDKTERWQESEAGDCYFAMMTDWRDFRAEEIEIPDDPDTPDTLDTPDVCNEVADQFDALKNSPTDD